MKISKTQRDKATKLMTNIYGFLYSVDDSLYSDEMNKGGLSKAVLLRLCDDVINAAKGLREIIDKHYIQDEYFEVVK